MMEYDCVSLFMYMEWGHQQYRRLKAPQGGSFSSVVFIYLKFK